ncbi:peroxiredoxin-like family protein [Parvularcula lutaonensis]|uniref:Peroxiredoxin-like family protein n=1 Tax=Parvularcula lutaonensis TaxID=491923 RepID=A0ABV7M7P0_9PROT|nr:peroxiredoxin-like family protein [Parvularcula lutaonensis]GGY42658.1 thioredoxin peroxidase [Parvularcula lutaonensis]
MLIPGKHVPELELSMLGADNWRLANAASENFTLLVFYRGYHCPICKSQLQELKQHLGRFEELGVSPFAVSMDSQERAQKTFEEWEIRGVPLLFDLTREQAKDWGLYLSKGFQESEPEIFSEPAMFLVRPSGELYAAYYQSVPFARPKFEDLAEGIEYILKKDYPTRGTETEQ